MSEEQPPKEEVKADDCSDPPNQEEKFESYPSDDENQYQESIVTGADGRRRIDVFKPKPNDVYSCIGQLDVEYDYMNQHKYRGFSHGTGTVVFVGNPNNKGTKLAYVLTCAHNIRLSLIHCTKQDCNTYRRKKKANGNITKCLVCKQINGKEQKEILVQATKITFRDRSIEHNNYGVTLDNYECKEIYVPNVNFRKHSKPKDGFDWCFLAFYDNGIYEKRLQSIDIELVDGLNVFKNDKNAKTFAIFGYPSDKNNEMFGMISNQVNQFEIKQNDPTQQNYLYQTCIDTKSGQSGAVIFFKEQSKIQICSIHVGGSNGTKKNPQPYNIATLINAEMVEIFKQIKRNNKMIGIQVIIDRIGSNDMDFKVIWDTKNMDDYYESNKVKLKVQIKEFDEYLFVDTNAEFKGNGQIINVNGLKHNTFYLMRVKCIFEESNNDSKYDDNEGNDAIVTSFKTKRTMTFLNKSKIITDATELDIFENMLKKQWNKGKYVLKLLYRSTEQNGFNDAAAFHKACDGKSKTITIILTDQHHIFGGYTTIPWASPSFPGQYRNDDSAFVFLLRSVNNQPKIYNNKNNNGANAVHADKYWGPRFGYDDILIGGSSKSYCTSNCSYNIQANDFVGGDSKADYVYFRYILYEVYQVETV
eukprot:295644_1